MNRSIVRIVPLQTLQRKINEMQPGEELFVYSEANFKPQLLSGHNHPAPTLLESPRQQTAPPFNCLRCEEAVQQSLSSNRRINACNCLTAIFCAPYPRLSQQQWQQWGSGKMLSDRGTEVLHIDKQDNGQDPSRRQISSPSLDPQESIVNAPINQNPNDTGKCWCAFCEFPEQVPHPAIRRWDTATPSDTATSIKTPSQNLVCTYHLCTYCAGHLESKDPLLLARFHHAVQQNLLRKYPELLSKVHLTRFPATLPKTNLAHNAKPFSRAQVFLPKTRNILRNYLPPSYKKNKFSIRRRNLRTNPTRRRPDGQ
jgi:hypothetical protein